MSRNKTPDERAAMSRKILAAVKTGATVEAACSFARTTKQSFYAWLKKDPELKADYEEALAHSEIFLLAEIRKDPSWQSKAWILERRFPERWAKREQSTAEISHRGVIHVPIAKGFTSEDLEKAASDLEPAK